MVSSIIKHFSDEAGTFTNIFVYNCTRNHLEYIFTNYWVDRQGNDHWKEKEFPWNLTLRKFASSWLATALARRVLPVPGGPYNKQPLGGVIPTLWKSSGLRSGSSITFTETKIYKSWERQHQRKKRALLGKEVDLPHVVHESVRWDHQ